MSLFLIVAAIVGAIWYFNQKKPQPSLRDAQIAELRELYKTLPKGFPDGAFVELLVQAFIEDQKVALAEPLRVALRALIQQEMFGDEPDYETMDFKQQEEFRLKVASFKARAVAGDKPFGNFLASTFIELVERLPKLGSPSPFNVPFIDAIPDGKRFITGIFASVMDESLKDVGWFEKLRHQMYRNICEVSGVDPLKPEGKKLLHAWKSDMTAAEACNSYLRGTPLRPLFEKEIPLLFTDQDRFNHTAIVAGAGAGKSTLIETLVRFDLAKPDPPSIVVIEPHSQLARKLFEADLTPHTIYLDPSDITHPFALNPFALNRQRFAEYNEATQEMVTAGVVQTFDYLFAGLFNMELTGKQSVPFGYLARLMLTIPHALKRNATIADMIAVMDDPKPYYTAIDLLPESHQDFFHKEFFPKDGGYLKTKEELRTRLRKVMQNPMLERLFSASENKFDFYTELNRPGALILVDTAEGFLKDGSAVLGRIVLSMVFQAILERSAEGSKMHPCFVYVDEARTYMDETTERFLREARKFNCGITLAMQDMAGVSEGLASAMAGSTGMKFASRLNDRDARFMSREMECEPEFIRQQRKLNFAAFMADITPSAISVPLKIIEQAASTGEAKQERVARNRQKVSFGRMEKAPRPASPHIPDIPDEEITYR